MVGKIIGALVGAEVEKRRQESGLKGAVIGMMAVGLAKRVVPLGLAIGGALVLKRMVKGKSEAAA